MITKPDIQSFPTVLALDLGTKFGFAVTMPTDQGLGIASGHATLPTKKDRGPGYRLWAFRRLLDMIANKTPGLRIVAYERVVRHSSSDAAHLYGAFMGLVQMWAHAEDLEVIEVSVGTIRKFATGKGNAGKPEAMAALRKKLPHMNFTTDDEGDALWLLLTILNRDFDLSADIMGDIAWKSVPVLLMSAKDLHGGPDS